jgi:FkbM family methyltransferase
MAIADPDRCSRSSLWLYRALLSVRPAQLASFLKKAFCIRRQVAPSRNGLVYWIDPVSVFGIDLLSQGIYEPDLTEVVGTLLRPGDVFVDVGGNEGYFSILAGSKVKDGLVFCIEPQWRLLSVIKRNIELNSVPCVSIHNVAFSDKKGFAELFLRPSTNTGASSFFRHWKLGGTSQRVQTITLDEFVAGKSLKRIRLIKIDCEGAEGLVIKGAGNCLQNQVFDFLVVDYHSQIKSESACDDVHAQIRSAGYQLAKFGGVNIYHVSRVEQNLASLKGSYRAGSWKELILEPGDADCGQANPTTPELR